MAHDFVCVDKSQIIDYITTSGTLGEPVIFAMTDNDLNRLAYNEYLGFQMCRLHQDDVFQLMTTIDRRFMAGLAYFLGSRMLKSAMIRVGNGIPELAMGFHQTIFTHLPCGRAFLSAQYH